MTERDNLTGYFRRQRASAIRKYRTAIYWCQRKDARAWALHYARLIRMMDQAR